MERKKRYCGFICFLTANDSLKDRINISYYYNIFGR